MSSTPMYEEEAQQFPMAKQARLGSSTDEADEKKEAHTTDFLITDEELNDCDHYPVHLIGRIQDGAGHVLFLQCTDNDDTYSVIGVDKKILRGPWVLSSEADPHALLGKPLSECLASSPVFVSSEAPEGEEEEEDDDDDDVKKPCSMQQAISQAIREMQSNSMDRTFLFVRVPTHQGEEADGKSSSWALSICTSAKVQPLESFSAAAGVDTSATSSSSPQVLCVEIEPMKKEAEANYDFSSTMVSLGSLMGASQELEHLCRLACDHVYDIFKPNYHRGMVYLFRDDKSGEVVHERKADHIVSSYQGLRFPATDICKPARDFFVKNGLRYNYDIQGGENPVIWLGPELLDMSQVRMRGIHKSHIIFLSNMGVKSSLAIAIVVRGQLWGMLSFHRHATEPFKPNLQQRIACETIASMLSIRIERQFTESIAQRSANLNGILKEWNKELPVMENIKELGEQIMSVCDADCLVAYHVVNKEHVVGDSQSNLSNQTVAFGDQGLCPTADCWKLLALLPATKMQICNTRAAALKIRLTSETCPAAGFCYFRSGATHLFLGRSLRSSNVKWAGNPETPKLRIGGILHPRNSFKQYMEKARQESREWTQGDLLILNVLRYHIVSG